MSLEEHVSERPSDRFLYVTEEIASLYDEASNAIARSPRASAVLSRACLEAVLSAMGYKGNLQRKIAAAVSEASPQKSLSAALRQRLPIIRFIGNSANHSFKHSNSRICIITADEAEWCLEILGCVLQEYYEDQEFTETAIMRYIGELRAHGIVNPPIW
ncbi:DUF4145 domain-containing protein [Shinella sp. M31]|uniref:DUF4145 domain-containing protein n=1 Tax=Shinella sp. M31 TaxID=3368615 RepID=UPI003B9FBA6F